LSKICSTPALKNDSPLGGENEERGENGHLAFVYNLCTNINQWKIENLMA
jgi:hypothetical protein